MTWGTRTLVLGLLVLLHIRTTIWAAPHVNHQKEHGAASTPLSLEKQKRHSDTSEILIQSIADDDSQEVVPLLLGLLILGTLILFALLLLGCLLFIRVAGARSSKYRLLQSDDPDAAHGEPATNSKPSQTFTYVDLSNMECACQDRNTGGHTTVVHPKFAVQFQTASRVEASAADAARSRDSVLASASSARKTSMRAGLSRADSRESSPEPIRRTASAEQKESRETVFSTASQGPPKKRQRKDSPEGEQKNGTGRHTHENTFWERNVVIRSYLPELELGVHARGVKTRHENLTLGEGKWEGEPKAYFHSHGAEVPDGAGASHTSPSFLGSSETPSTPSPKDRAGVVSSLPENSNEASRVLTQTRAPEDVRMQVFGEDCSTLRASLNPPATVTTTTAASGVAPCPLDARVSDTGYEEANDLYYGHVPLGKQKPLESNLSDRSQDKDVEPKSGIEASETSKVEDVSMDTTGVHAKPAATRSNLERTSDSLISVNSARLRRLFEYEAAKCRAAASRASMKSTPSLRRRSEPSKKTPVIRHEQMTARSPHSAEAQNAESVESSVPVPQMVAYFDRGQSSKQWLDKRELIKTNTTDALRERSPEERSERALTIYTGKVVPESLVVDEREPFEFDTLRNSHPKSPTERLPLDGVIEVYHDVPFEGGTATSERDKVDSPAPFDSTFSEDRRHVREAEGTAGVYQMFRPIFDKETREAHQADAEPQSQPTTSEDQKCQETTGGGAEIQSSLETGQSPEKWNTLEKETPDSVWEKSPQERRRMENKTPEVLQKPPSGPVVSGDEADFMASPSSGQSIVTPEVSSVSFKLKLPEPPLDRTRPEPKVSRPGQDSAFTLGCGMPYKRRHDEHGSTEPFSLDEQRESRSYISSDLETSTGNEESEKESLASTPMATFSLPHEGGLPGQKAATLLPKSSLGTDTPQLVLEPSAGTELIQPTSSEVAPTGDFPNETPGEFQSDKIPRVESMKLTSPAPEGSDSYLQKSSEDYNLSLCTAKSPGAYEKSEPVYEPLIIAERKSLLFPPLPDESELRDFGTSEKQPVSLELLEYYKNREATESERSKHNVGLLSTGSMPAEGQSIPYSAMPSSRLPESSQQTSQWSSKEALEVPATEEQSLPECRARVSCDIPFRLRAEQAPGKKPELKLHAPESKNQPLSTRSGSYIEDDSIRGLEHPEIVRRKTPPIGDQVPLEEWKKELLSVRGRLLKKTREADTVQTPVEESASAPASKLEEPLPIELTKNDTLAPHGHGMDGSVVVDTRRVLQARDSRQILSAENPLAPIEKEEKELANLAYHTATGLKSPPDYGVTEKLERETEDHRERPLEQSLEKKELLSIPQGQVPILFRSPAERQRKIPEIARHIDDSQLSERNLEKEKRTSFERVAERTSPRMPSENGLQLSTHVLEKKDRTQLKPETQASLQSKSLEVEDQLEKLSIPEDAGSSVLLKPVLDKKKQGRFQTDKSDHRETLPEKDQRRLEPPDESVKRNRGQSSLEAPRKRSRSLLDAIDRGPILPRSPEDRRRVDRREARKDTNGKPRLQLVLEKEDQGLVRRESLGQLPVGSPKNQWHFETTEGGSSDGHGQSDTQVLERQERQPFRPKFSDPESSKPPEDNSEFQSLVIPTDVHDNQLSKSAVEKGNRDFFKSYGPNGHPTIAREDQSSDKSVKIGSEQSLMEVTERKNLTPLVPKYQGPIRPRSPEDRHQVGRRELDKDAKGKQFVQQYVDRKGQGLLNFNKVEKFYETSPEEQRYLQTTEERMRGGPGQPPVHILERQKQQLWKSEFQVPVSSEAPEDESQLQKLITPKDARSSPISKLCSNKEEKEVFIAESSSQRQSLPPKEQRELQGRNESVKGSEQPSIQALEKIKHPVLTRTDQGPVLPKYPVDIRQVDELDVDKDVCRKQLLQHVFDEEDEILLKVGRPGELQTRSSEGQRRLETTEGGTSADRGQTPGEVLERQERQLLESELQGPLKSKPPGNVSELEEYATQKSTGGVRSSQPALENQERGLFIWNSPGQFQRLSPEDQRQLQNLVRSVKGDGAQSSFQILEKRDYPMLTQKDEGPIVQGSSDRRLQLRRREAYEGAYDKQVLPHVADRKNQELFKTDSREQLQIRSPEGQRRLQTTEYDAREGVLFTSASPELFKSESPGKLHGRSSEVYQLLQTREGGVNGGTGQPPTALERQERHGPIASKSPRDGSQLEGLVVPRHAAGGRFVILAPDKEERELFISDSPRQLQALSYENQRRLRNLDESVNSDLGPLSMRTLKERYQPLLEQKDESPIFPKPSEGSRHVQELETGNDPYKWILQRDLDREDQDLLKLGSSGQLQARPHEDQRLLQSAKEGAWSGRVQPPVHVTKIQDQYLLKPNFQNTVRHTCPEHNPQREELDSGGGGQLKAHSPGQLQARSPGEQKSIQVLETTVDNQGQPSSQLKETEDRSLQNIAIQDPSRLSPFEGEQQSGAFDDSTGSDRRPIFKRETKEERQLFRLSPPGSFQLMTPDKEIPIVQPEEATKTYLEGPILEQICKEKDEFPESSASRPVQSRSPRVERQFQEPRRTIDAQLNFEPELETTVHSKTETSVVEASPSSQKCLEYSPFSTISPREEIPDAVSPLLTSTGQERTNGKLTRLLTEFTDDQTSGTVGVTKLALEFTDNDEPSAVEEQRLVPSSHSEVERIGRAAMYFLVPDSTDPSHDIDEASKGSGISGRNAHESSPRDRRSRWAPYELSSPTCLYQPTTPENMARSSDAKTSSSPVAAQGSKDLINFQAGPTRQTSYLDSEVGKRSGPTTPDPSSASPKEDPSKELPD